MPAGLFSQAIVHFADRGLPSFFITVPNPILTIIHKETTVPGLIGSKLTELNYTLDIRAPILGDPLPDDLTPYSGVLVFGGPMSVNDDEPYLKQEMAWIERVLAAKLPYLGICLGAQMLAKVLGANVMPHTAAIEEIGYYSVYATEQGKALFEPHMKVYQWHKDGFELPEGAVLLARGDHFPNQAFRWGDRAYGVQFHPEMTAEMVDFWTTQGADLLGGPHAQSREMQLAGQAKYSTAVERWLETFLKNWLAVAA
ncbi:MAG: GMP synthase (glutamine-hydrolysing) [Phormidesmis priestleyi Ana]|uniref:GMP synthase (Glutamine-hydrolysing) n=1 Tax=Phormidesmis priestleyi Ana TaxID=1666911 RepID=A0A0P7ZPI3_9CYAN|nr:MAG: GMP synthase (glutamine-hydrolysing) [Phormidesmis priestleyi Ana]